MALNKKISFLVVKVCWIVLLGCGAPQDSVGSNLNLINGIKTSEFPAVVKLEQGLLGLFGYCTGTFIKHNIMLTAAHCVKDFTKVSANRKKSIRYYIHRNFESNSQQFDIALILFPDQTSQSTLNISLQKVENNSEVKIVGFGHDSYVFNEETQKFEISTHSLDKVKRVGSNYFHNEQENKLDNTIYFESESTDLNIGTEITHNTSLGNGDSGGPLIIESSGIVGIASRHKLFLRNESKVNISYFVDASIENMKDFYDNAAKDGISIYEN